MNLLDIVHYFGIALTGAAINAVAGGGTFLTFPVLILGGMNAIGANIMSTIALWPGSVASSIAYRSERTDVPQGMLIPFIIISILGSILGAVVLLSTPEITFKRLVPWLLLGATLIFTFGRHWIGRYHAVNVANSGKRKIITYLWMLLIAAYGGYFGAGIGILMLAMLQLMGFTHIHQMNALKTVLGSAINAVAFLMFLFSGRVVWDMAMVMISGAIIGGYAGAHLSLNVSPQKIRVLVSVIGFTMSAYFFLYGV